MKVLVYIEKNQLRPVGGHLGYNNNLYKEVCKNNDLEIDYLNIDKGYQKIKKISGIDSWKHFRKQGIALKKFVKHFLLEYGSTHKAIVDLNQYDMVHFHTSLDMYQVRDSLRDYKGKVILTSHSPTLLSKEIYATLSNTEKRLFALVYDKLIKMDEYAFNRADYYIYPCEEAEEPYYHVWDKFAELKKSRKDRFYYVPTGINPCTPKLPMSEVREKYNIPEDAFVVCYVGRHNEIKGYDLLKEMCQKLIEQNPNVYVLVAGREGPLYGLDHDRWIEVGWTNDPHSIISASDCFVLPNRETYFDLIMLEILSLGSIVVASNTGGNKYFKGNDSILLYEDVDEAVAKLKELINMSKQDRMQLSDFSKNLFLEKFTCDKFYLNYKKVYKQLYESH